MRSSLVICITPHILNNWAATQQNQSSGFPQSPQIQRLARKMKFRFVARLYMILSKERKIKALISLRGCPGWPVPMLFANPRRQVFSRRGPINIDLQLHSQINLIKRRKAVHSCNHLHPPSRVLKVRETTKIRKRYNRVPHLTQVTTWVQSKKKYNKHHHKEPRV